VRVSLKNPFWPEIDQESISFIVGKREWLFLFARIREYKKRDKICRERERKRHFENSLQIVVDLEPRESERMA